MTARARRGRSRTALTTVVLGLLALVGALAVEGATAPPAQAFDEDAIVQLVNEARWADGSAGVIRNPEMDAVALGWAQQLAASGTLSHNPSYADQVPGGWTAVAENVAQGYGSASAVMDGWMNSSGHRANILGRYTDIGVALIEGGGTTWGVQVFAAYPGHTGPAAPQAQPEPVAPIAEVPVEAAQTAPDAPDATAQPTPSPAASPSPAPVPTATTRSPSPEPTASADTLDLTADRGDPSPVALVAVGLGGAALLIAVLAWFISMRRRRPDAPGSWPFRR